MRTVVKTTIRQIRSGISAAARNAISQQAEI